MAEKTETTEWSKRLEKAREMVDKMGEMSGLTGMVSIKFAVETAVSLLRISRELNTEVSRLADILGTKATDEMIGQHLDVFGNAFIFEGRLLDPAKMAIKTVKGKMDEKALAIVRDLHEIYFEDGRAMAPPTEPEAIVKDGIAMIDILKRANDLLGGESCLDSQDSKTSSTGDSPSTPSKAPSTTASPEEDAGSGTSPSASATSERDPEDKPVSDLP